MKLQSLYLRNFRNFAEAHIDFGARLNVFCGQNAQGKTNLLEAIVLLSTGRSFRTAHLSELIREGTSFFFIEAQILRHRVVQILRISFNGQIKRMEYNGMQYSSFQPLLGLLPSVLYAPHDIDLIAGSPSSRRRFLNLHLAQSDPLYVHHLLRFWRAVKQRNALLRTPAQEGIDCWEQEMAVSAVYLFEKRKELLETLNLELQTTCPMLSKELIDTAYQPSQPTRLPLGQSYLDHLKKSRFREKQFGATLSGPHRDDFSIRLDQKPTRLFASEGQKRTAIAALRLAEWRRLEKQIEAPPILGVDDFQLHLDVERQMLFRNTLEHLGQVFVTTPETDCAWPSAHVLAIHAGSVASKHQPI